MLSTIALGPEASETLGKHSRHLLTTHICIGNDILKKKILTALSHIIFTTSLEISITHLFMCEYLFVLSQTRQRKGHSL